MAKHLRDDIDKFYEYGIYVPTRTIYLGDTEDKSVDADMSARAVKGLHMLDAISESPITVLLNTVGGDVTHGLAIYDAIKSCRSRVTVVGIGNVMSMGAWILQAADHRVLTPNSCVMIHLGTDEIKGHTKDVVRWAEQGEKWNARMTAEFLERIRQREPLFLAGKLKRMLEFDTILTAVQAVDLGLADEIQEVP